MTSSTSGEAEPARRRRRVTSEIKESLRALSIQLSLLNHQVGAHAGLKDVDLSCLDIINRYGPISPTALARRAGLHPATITGILDRLQRGGWVTRERDPEASDRRAVMVRALKERNAELFELYGGMSSKMDDICDRYTDAELDLLADFLRRTTDAGQDATGDIARR
ncbi:MarR family transcriptional regulator [Nonomuraea fastidiosa]|jgi:DNA-binding MarR family transcriptional regulator|uniref:MarR family transcriptional regulator n=1 Tax=Nonomuraea TaxID=83681 RepID=UPI0032520A80